MPNLICFPHYTCGGMLCDILNDTFSPLHINGGIMNIAHSLGKIGDTDTVYTNYDSKKIMKKIEALAMPANTWIGTHCWPDQLLLEEFGHVIVVTTATYRSRIYRWTRAYHHYFLPQWKNLQGMELIDKSRATAKNYLIPFKPIHADNVYNLEFAEVVENSKEFYHAINHHECSQHVERWQSVNDFLYQKEFWNSDAVKHYHLAEFEVGLNRFYRYD